jgi:hypothetical protein
VIPEVAAVVEAARRMVDSVGDPTKGLGPGDEYAYRALVEAVEALEIRASRPAGAVTYEETDRTWGEVVVQDEILSEKTQRWYEVTRSVMAPDGATIKVNIKGSVKPIIRPVSDPVRLKRGVMGDSVDTLELLFSGTYALGQHRADAVTGTGPMIQSHEETQEALSNESE